MAGLGIKKGDRVEIIAGKDKGKKGKVLRTLPNKQRVVIEGAMMIKRHTRPTRKVPQAGIVSKEGTIHVSNVLLICPSCGKAARVGHRREDDKVIRVCRNCGQDIDK
jgi:large subunit ribosomal protein L24